MSCLMYMAYVTLCNSQRTIVVLCTHSQSRVWESVGTELLFFSAEIDIINLFFFGWVVQGRILSCAAYLVFV